jgi:hypothetical protein
VDVRLDTSDSQWRRACLTKQLPKTEWLTCDRSGYSWSIEGLGLEMASDEELAQLVKDDYPEDCQMNPRCRTCTTPLTDMDATAIEKV